MEEPFVFDASRNIVYRMYADSPGMIYYEFVDKDQRSQEENPVMSSEEEKIYKEAQMAVVQSMLSNLSSIAGMIEVPDDNWFSSIFSVEAILKAILENCAPMGMGGGVCPVFA